MKKMIVVLSMLLLAGCSQDKLNNSTYDSINVVEDNHVLMDGDNEHEDEKYDLKTIEDSSDYIIVVKALNQIDETNSVNPNHTFDTIDEMVAGYENAGVLSYFMSKVEVISSSKGDLKKGDVINVLYHAFVSDRTLHVTKADLDVPLNKDSVGVLFIDKNTDQDLRDNYINRSHDQNIEYIEDDFYITSLKSYASISFDFNENALKTNLTKEIIEKYNK